MFRFLLEILNAALTVLADSSPYLLFGFFLAGLIHVYLPAEKVLKFLGKSNFRSVLNASLIGLPLPLCSCAVVPTAISLRKQGASRGAVFSFLISTPESSITSLGISLALLDPLMTFFRPIAAFITALLTGLGVNVLDKTTPESDKFNEQNNQDNCSCADGSESNGKTATENPSNHAQKLRRALSYSYNELLDDLAPWLMLGLLAAGVISAIIPEELFSGLLSRGIWSMLLMLLIGIPLYVCAEASTPIAAALILKGLSPGAALVFMLTGPATNIGSLIVLSRYFSKRAMVVYLACIAIISLIFGVILNLIYSSLHLNVRATLGTGAQVLPTWIKISATLIFGILLLRSLIKTKHLQKLWSSTQKKLSLSSPKLRNALIASGTIIYLSDCFFAVPFGYTGMVVSFGKVVQSNLSPGLQLRLPRPFSKTVLIDTGQVCSLEFGFRRSSSLMLNASLPLTTKAGQSSEKLDLLPSQDQPDESELFSGDENLIDIDITVFYRLADAYKAAYRVQNIEDLIRELTASQVLAEIASRPVADGLTCDWMDFEEHTQQNLQFKLDQLGTGIKIQRVNLIYAHAPDVVHAVYRDVASAMEDKFRLINLAEADSITKIADARARSNSMITTATSDSAQKISQATGDASRFLAMAKSTKTKRAEQQFRLNAEVAETTLVNLDKILTLTRNSPGLDLIVLPQSSDAGKNLPPEVLERLGK